MEEQEFAELKNLKTELTRQQRRCGVLSSLVAILGLLSAISICGSLYAVYRIHWGAEPVRGRGAAEFKTVKAEKIVLQNQNGAELITLDSSSTGFPQIRMVEEESGRRLTIFVSKDATELLMKDADGNDRVMFGVTSEGYPLFRFMDGEGRPVTVNLNPQRVP